MKRSIYLDLHESGDGAGERYQYTGVEYMRITYDAGGGNAHTPAVYEVWAGQQRQLAFNPLYPYGASDDDSLIEVWESDNGVDGTYKKYSGRKSLEAELHLGDSTQAGKIASWRADIGYGHRPFIWTETPSSPVPYLMRLRDPNQFRMPRIGPNVRTYSLSAIERGGSLYVDE